MKVAFTQNEKFENPFFIATVEDNNDPTFNYRVKVRISHIHPNTITTEQLPWAAKVDSSFMGMDSSSSIHSVPEIGSQVLVLAIGNNINSLLYLGCLYKKSDSTPTGDTYLNGYGIYDKQGNFIELDKIQKTLKLIYDGKIDISKITEMKIGVEGNLNITCKGNVNLEATGGTNIKGGPVTIDSSVQMGFTCVPNCLFTGAPHTSPMTAK